MMPVIETDPHLEKNFKGHSDEITSLAFSSTNEHLVSTSLDSTVMIWDIQSGNRSFRFSGHKDAVMEARFSPDCQLVASGSRDRAVRLWNSSKNGIEQLKAHRGGVNSVNFTNDSQQLLTCSQDKTIKLWSIAMKTPIFHIIEHKKNVCCARISPLEDIIASCSEDDTVKLYDIRTGRCIHTFLEKNGYATKLTFHPTGRYIATAMSSNGMKIYDMRTLSLLQQYNSHKKTVNDVAFHKSGRYLMSASVNGEIKVLDLLEGQAIYILKGHEVGTSVKAVAFTPNGKYFATGGVDFMILFWKTNFDKEAENSEMHARKEVKGRTNNSDSSQHIIVNSLHQLKSPKSATLNPYSSSQEFSCGDDFDKKVSSSYDPRAGGHKANQLESVVKSLANDLDLLAKSVKKLSKAQKASNELLREIALQVFDENNIL